MQADQPEPVILSLFSLQYVSLRGLTFSLRGCRLERSRSFESLVAVHELCRHIDRKGVTAQGICGCQERNKKLDSTACAGKECRT